MAGCSTHDSDEKSKSDTTFTWPVGKFLYVHEHSGYFYEDWEKTDEKTYKGEGHFLTRDGIDTLFSMSLRLVHDNDKTTMFYSINNEEENKDLEFTLTKTDDGLFVFENPFRDFPSIMQYRIFGDTAIEVTERGFENNKEQVRKYMMNRIN